MRASVFYEHGAADVIQLADDLPVPEPGLGEVRVKIKAAALNRLDLFVREGWSGLDLHMPHIGGSDGAGDVDAVGEGVTNFAPGDRVCIDPTVVPAGSPDLSTGLENQSRDGTILGEHMDGLAAEYRVVPARNLLKMPDHFSYQEAAAAGLVYVTAWHSLITRGELQPGESVLVVGATGGVNSASIQIAKLAGAKVYAVGSNADKCDLARELGADEVIDRSQEDWSRAVYRLTEKQGVDVVVDNVGQATMFRSIRSARNGGRILVVGNTSGPKFELDLRYIFTKHLSIIGSTMGPHQDYVKVMKLLFEGKLKSVIGQVIALDQVAEGHRLLEAGAVYGKVVINVSD